MPNIKQYQSHQIFHIARKTLSDGELHAVFGRTTRYMQMWAADPRHCEVVRRNVLDQVREFLNALDDHGRGDVARAALEYMIGQLPFRLREDGGAVSDKGCIDGEIADLTRALGRLATVIDTAREDGVIETDELIRIKRAAAELKRGVDELLDAAGIRGGV
jgi:hypothetical protein